MSFARPTLTELVNRAKDDINGRLTGADSRLRRSTLGVLATVFMGAVQGLYGFLDYLARQILPDTADGDHLVRWASIFSVHAKAATLATGQITLAGANGAVIEAGSVLQDGSGLEYLTQADVTITDGVAVVTVAAKTAGIASVAEAGTRLTFVSPVAGVAATAVVAGGGLVGGADQESEDLLRQRLLERIRAAPAGGARHDYKRWTLEVPEVTRAWIYPNWIGAGTVGVAFVMDGRDDILPLPADVAAVEAYLADLASVTAELVVFSPIADPVNFRITGLAPGDAATRAAVQAGIADLFLREAEPGGVIPITHVSEAISLAAGETDHVLASPLVNIVQAPGHLAALGEFDWD